MGSEKYEIVIGIEAHAQLNTRTKMFCACPAEFCLEPNTQTCVVCAGHPGVLPVVNAAAVEKALGIAIALNCQIAPVTRFDRKNYYYPDLPKNYQISQNYDNLGVGGHLDLKVDGRVRSVRIHNVHLEEDAGKLIHPETPGADFSLVELNRAGTPLAEIVTEPDLRSVEEAGVYMDTLRSILLYIDASDCKMQEGSLRFEASISLRPFGQTAYGGRVEIKNLNSMRAVLAALQYEVERQTALLESGGVQMPETRLWDEARGETAVMRSKEGAADYRYFPEPDLPPVHISAEFLNHVRASLPELPVQKQNRFVEQYGLPAYDAGVLVQDRAVADYFEKAAALVGDAKAVSNFMMTAVLREINERRIPIGEFKVRPEGLAELLRMVASRTVSLNMAKEILAEMAETGQSASNIVERKGLQQVSDGAAIEPIVRKVLDANPKAVADFKAGKASAQKFIIGQVMRESRGKADPAVVVQLVNKLLG